MALMILSNITVGSQQQIDLVLNDGPLMQKVLGFAVSDHAEVRSCNSS